MADEKKSGGGHPFLIIIGIIALIFLIRGQGGLSGFVGSSGSGGDGSSGQTTERVPTQREKLSDIEDTIEDISDQVAELNASRYQGQVELRRSRATQDDPEEEYIEIRATRRLDAPVNIYGWRLINTSQGTQVFLDNTLDWRGRFGGIPRVAFIIERNDTVFLFTTDNPENEPDDDYTWYLYADENDELWEDDDTVFLIDRENRIVDTLEI